MVLMPEVERPYDPPLGAPEEIDGVPHTPIARVQMARSASHWRDDIEALLVEYEMPVELVTTVVQVVDACGISIRQAVEQLRLALDG